MKGVPSIAPVTTRAAQIGARMARIATAGWPWLVAEVNGAVASYAYAGQLNARSGYRYTCENSTDVRHDLAGRGVGGALLAACATIGFRRVVAAIGDADNAGSIALHTRHGVVPAGMLQSVGYKFGRWLDVVHMQRTLEEPS